METRRIDEAGRITIPKNIRKKANIGANDKIKIEYSRGRIVLTPLTNTLITIDGEVTEVDPETLKKIQELLKKGDLDE